MPSAAELGIESVQEVVENIYGLAGEAIGDEYSLLCPNPNHLDRNPSCSINLETGFWHCLACGVGGDLVQLGVILKGEGATRGDIESLLSPTSAEALLTSVKRKLGRLGVSGHMRRGDAPRLPGPYEDGSEHPELLERGFTPETLQRWGVRFANTQVLQGRRGEFTIRNSIAIPIRDEGGHLLCWCYRATKQSPEWQPRYLYTDHVEVSDLWFGLQWHHSAPWVVVVEGALDAMWLDQIGIPALALLGSKMGQAKLLQLQRYRRLYLLGDRDSAGALAVQRIGQMLGDRLPLFVLKYPKWSDRTDPQASHPVDLEIMMERAVPWTTWLLKSKS